MVTVGTAGNSGKLVRVTIRVYQVRLWNWAAMPRCQHDNQSSIISVKASLTRIMPLMATGFDASAAACQSILGTTEPLVELWLFSSSVECGLDGSDPPKSTSSSKFPDWTGVGDLPVLAIRFSTLRDLGSLIGGPGCCCVA